MNNCDGSAECMLYSSRNVVIAIAGAAKWKFRVRNAERAFSLATAKRFTRSLALVASTRFYPTASQHCQFTSFLQPNLKKVRQFLSLCIVQPRKF